jgi:hypothetical protein
MASPPVSDSNVSRGALPGWFPSFWSRLLSPPREACSSDRGPSSRAWRRSLWARSPPDWPSVWVWTFAGGVRRRASLAVSVVGFLAIGLAAATLGGLAGLTAGRVIGAATGAAALAVSIWLTVGIGAGTIVALARWANDETGYPLTVGLARGLAVGIAGAIVGGLFVDSVAVRSNGPFSLHFAAAALSMGLGVGVVVGMRRGGGSYLRHQMLRVLLARLGLLPRDLVAFLDRMARHALLRRRGGAYHLIHELLLEYFATAGH